MSSNKDIVDTIHKKIFDIESLLNEYKGHIQDVLSSNDTPDALDIAGFAKILQDYYTGVEDIFELIAKQTGEDIPRGESSHRDLLLQMSSENKFRTIVISDDSKNDLSKFLAFRHKSRHLYSVHHNWSRMRILVSNVTGNWALLRNEIEAFIKKI